MWEISAMYISEDGFNDLTESVSRTSLEEIAISSVRIYHVETNWPSGICVGGMYCVSSLAMTTFLAHKLLAKVRASIS